MKWKKKEKVNLRFDNFTLIETRTTFYESDQGHVIKKDHLNGGYFFENYWFSRLKDAKNFVENC
jgi:hypothetical protein